MNQLALPAIYFKPPNFGGPSPLIFLLLLTVAAILLFMPEIYGQTRLPGTDESASLESAGTLLRIVDTALFSWAARLCAGLCVFTAGLHLKEQRFGIAALCIVGAIVIGTAPKWVKEIFSIGGGSVFSKNETPSEVYHV